MSFREHLNKGVKFADMEQVIRIEGELFTVAFRGNTEQWMALIYPDVVALSEMARHLSNVSGRGEPYSLELVSSFHLISETLQLVDEPKLDIAEVAKLYEERPQVFFKLAGCANIAVGNSESPTSGQIGWMALLHQLNRCLRARSKKDVVLCIRAIQAQVESALRDFFPDDKVQQLVPSAEDVDRAMEVALGNSPAAEAACAEPLPTGV